MAANRFYSNSAVETELTADITAADTAITVASVSGFPGSTPFTLVLDSDTAAREIISVTDVAGVTLTVQRGQDNTSATSHPLGATVAHSHTARDFRESQEHIGATSNVHGIGAGNATVGTGTAQTLTNKDLTSTTNALPTNVVRTTGAQVLADKDLTAVSNTFPPTLVDTTTAQSMINKDLSDPSNTFAESVAPQPGDVKMTAKGVTGGGAVIDGGWLKCDGTAVSRSTYADLFSAIGTTYGSGNGTTTFNLPDIKARFPIGAGVDYALGANDGRAEAERGVKHTHAVGSLATSITSQTATRGSGALGSVQQDHQHVITGSTANGDANRFAHLALHFLIHI